jgi:Leucine-rich repeat (LRR) protein
VNLETLKLGRNRLVSLPSGLFRHNRRLRTLELANNHLRQVSGLLADLPALVHLDLSRNYLLSLGEGVFHNSPEIHTLLLGKYKGAEFNFI